MLQILNGKSICYKGLMEAVNKKTVKLGNLYQNGWEGWFLTYGRKNDLFIKVTPLIGAI